MAKIIIVPVIIFTLHFAKFRGKTIVDWTLNNEIFLSLMSIFQFFYNFSNKSHLFVFFYYIRYIWFITWEKMIDASTLDHIVACCKFPLGFGAYIPQCLPEIIIWPYFAIRYTILYSIWLNDYFPGNSGASKGM